MGSPPVSVQHPAGSWIRIPRRHSCPWMRLVCLPHAGAGASAYHAWSGVTFAAGVEMRSVQYPGREDRIHEPLVDSCASMVNALADEWPRVVADAPYAVFGHSMGALIAFELVRELARRRACPLPARLFLSGRNPPHYRSTAFEGIDRSEEQLLAKLQADGAIQMPEAVLQDPDMVRLLTPILRADCAISDGSENRSAAPLDIPFTMLGGIDDPWTTPETLEEWARYSTKPCRLRMVSGGHLFHQASHRTVIHHILADLASVENP